ncbi:MAG: DUF92 domain-containing protein [Gemmatimonadaceae bacterium]
MAVAAAARRTRSLSPGGAAAAVVVGTLSVGAGWEWGALLVAFFVASSALSAVGATERARRTAGIVARGGERDAVQVLANGGLFALAALGQTLSGGPAPGPSVWLAAGVGALAAAAADTWATEIGTLARRPPRMLLGLRRVPAGTSGAVSWPGSLAGLAGAAFIALVAWAAGWPAPVAAAAVVGGVAGSVADSLLGATIQARRRCPLCHTSTERIVHGCGGRTLPDGGVPWVDNDVVNVLATTVGAATTVALAAALASLTTSGRGGG